MERQLCGVYPKGVEFTPTSNGTSKAEWLDIVLELKPDGTLDLRPKKAELEWVHGTGAPCGRHLVPPFVSCLSLDWTLLRGMAKCRCARLLQGDALGMIRVLSLNCGPGSGNTLIWKSTSMRTLLAIVQRIDVAHLSPIGKKEREKILDDR